jgi:hypothetical protein
MVERVSEDIVHLMHRDDVRSESVGRPANIIAAEGAVAINS